MRSHGDDLPRRRPSSRPCSRRRRWPSCCCRARARRATAPTSTSRSTRSYPKVAGQHADYLFYALKAYQIEGNPNIGRANAIMAAQVKQFTRRELKAMAEYLASLPGELQTVRQQPFK